ncbi:hypothetical protein C8J56DRAFT_860025 [Mycena floridula]|nr:hypothetical protein C8J56DRAFT_860025 [Mycena floridula]
MSSITISYHLNPPAGVNAGGLKRSKALEFPVQNVQLNTHVKYYAHLRLAIAAARDELGDELTRWRDAVGKEEIGEGVRTEEEDEEG